MLVSFAKKGILESVETRVNCGESSNDLNVTNTHWIQSAQFVGTEVSRVDNSIGGALLLLYADDG